MKDPHSSGPVQVSAENCGSGRLSRSWSLTTNQRPEVLRRQLCADWKLQFVSWLFAAADNRFTSPVALHQTTHSSMAHVTSIYCCLLNCHAVTRSPSHVMHLRIGTRSSAVADRQRVCVYLLLASTVQYIITRHSLLYRRARYLVYCMYVCLFVNDFSTTRGPIHAKVRMQAYSGSGRVFSPFGGWRPPAGGKRGK